MSGAGEGRRELSSKAQQMVAEWLKLDKNLTTRAEIQTLVDDGNETELNLRLGSRMKFGTAGLRALMGVGYSRMNDLTIIQTSQGLACYVKEQFGDSECELRGVAIGYDARHNSLRFAELAAGVFLNKGFKVYLFSTYTPTPFMAYAVKNYRCLAGIQVTASHNPKEYNGYKVFWDNGSQIISPHDIGIQSQILRNLDPWPTSWDTSCIKESSKVIDPLAAVIDGYFTEIQRYCYRREENATTSLKFTYSSMHGVGAEAVRRAFKAFNLPEYTPVLEQIDPHPDFPTVTFPNPEEGKSALDLSIQTANAAGSTIILATDPDADRLALAEKDPTSGSWKIFTGNETGALMGWWAFKNYKERNPNFDGSKVHMLASTVSSKFLRALATAEGFQFQETLTGFKWIGNRSHELLKQGHEVLFAFEEAIGFMFGTTILDKDGISAAAVMAEFAAWLYSHNKTFVSQLEEINIRYGRHVSEVLYMICYEPETIKQLFGRLRAGGKYPTTCGSAKVVSVVDLTVGYDSSRPPDYKPVLPVDPNVQLITFELDNRCVFTLRTSGTEPKIKYYIEVATLPGVPSKDEDLKLILSQTVKGIMEEFLQAERYGLIPRPT